MSAFLTVRHIVNRPPTGSGDLIVMIVLGGVGSPFGPLIGDG
jgi:ABC-type branched-subunit amino acid transport system permease subunit